MNMRFLLAMTLATFPAMPLLAQDNCPKERTKNVPADVTIGPLQNCGGFSYQIGGVQVGTPQNGCPLFVIYTPPYEIAAPSEAETKVVPMGAPSPVTMASFVCTTDWFVIIPIGTTCVLDKTVTIGAVGHLVTVGCNP